MAAYNKIKIFIGKNEDELLDLLDNKLNRVLFAEAILNTKNSFEFLPLSMLTEKVIDKLIKDKSLKDSILYNPLFVKYIISQGLFNKYNQYYDLTELFLKAKKEVFVMVLRHVLNIPGSCCLKTADDSLIDKAKSIFGERIETLIKTYDIEASFIDFLKAYFNEKNLFTIEQFKRKYGEDKIFSLQLDKVIANNFYIPKPIIEEPSLNKTFEWANHTIGLCSTSYSHQDCILTFKVKELFPGIKYRIYFGIAAGATVDKGTGEYWYDHDYIEIITSANSIKLESSSDNYLRTLPDEKPFVKGVNVGHNFPGQSEGHNYGWIWTGENAPYLDFVATAFEEEVKLRLHTNQRYNNEGWGYVLNSAKIEKLI